MRYLLFSYIKQKLLVAKARVSLNDYRASVLFAEKHSVELDLDNEEKLKKIKIKYIKVFIFFVSRLDDTNCFITDARK